MKKYTVYLIRHIVTGQILYIGKTKNLKRRAYQHLSLHTETKKWLSVIGTGNVLIEEVAEFNNETDALKYEDELIIKYGTITNGYNKCRSGLIYKENPEEYHKEYKKEYCKTDKYRKYHRELQRKYSKTEKYIEIRKKAQRKYDRERIKTDKRIEYMRDYQRDYNKSKKMGISVAEYRKLKNDQPIQLTINF